MTVYRGACKVSKIFRIRWKLQLIFQKIICKMLGKYRNFFFKYSLKLLLDFLGFLQGQPVISQNLSKVSNFHNFLWSYSTLFSKLSRILFRIFCKITSKLLIICVKFYNNFLEIFAKTTIKILQVNDTKLSELYLKFIIISTNLP